LLSTYAKTFEYSGSPDTVKGTSTIGFGALIVQTPPTQLTYPILYGLAVDGLGVHFCVLQSNFTTSYASHEFAVLLPSCPARMAAGEQPASETSSKGFNSHVASTVVVGASSQAAREVAALCSQVPAVVTPTTVSQDALS